MGRLNILNSSGCSWEEAPLPMVQAGKKDGNRGDCQEEEGEMAVSSKELSKNSCLF